MKRFTIDQDSTQTIGSANSEIQAFESGDYAAKRRAFIRDWIADRMRSISVLGAGSLIFLPLLGASAAQAQQGFVEVSSIDGVSNAAFNPDGSLQLTMANGQVVTVAAAEVTILPNGALAISTAAAEMVAGVAAAAGGIAGVGAGALAAGAAAAAAGGSDDDAPVVGGGGVAGAFNPQVLNAGGVAGVQNFTGFAPADSVVQITVYDANGDPLLDGAGDPFVFQAVADGDGNYSVPVDMGALGLADGEEYQFVVEAFEDDGTGNPTGDALGSETVILGVDTTPPALAIDTPVADNDEINIADSQTDLIITGTTDAEDGQMVIVHINGVDYTGAAAGGVWSVTIPAAALQALPDGAVDIQFDVADAAGNLASDDAGAVLLTTIQVDLTPPTIDIDSPLSFGDFLNLADSGADQTITGTSDGANDREVTLTVTDANGDSTDFTGMTDAATGDWSIDLPAATLQALAEGNATLSATVTDAFGNPPAAPATADFVVDTIAPDIAVTAITDDFLPNVINAEDQASGFNVSGTSNAEAGQLVTVMINGIDAGNTGAVQADGTWTVLIEPVDVAELVHDDTPVFTARVQDLAGNETTSAPLPATVNTTPPTVDVTVIGADGFINIAEHGTDGITVEGTTNAEDGQDVEVTLTQGATEATVTVQADGGTFTAPFTPADLAPFIDGPVTATAEVTNQAGNSNSSAPFGAVVDLTAPTIDIDDPLAGDNVFTKFNEINGLEVTGTTDAEPGQTVTVSYDGMDYTGPVVDGAPGPNTFTVLIPPAAFDGVDTGDTITGITAQVNDVAGNPSAVASAADLAVDVDGPTIDINPIAGDDIINIAESEDLAGVEISGTSSGAEGETVTVNILVGGVTVFTETDTADAVTGAWSVTIPQGVAWLVNNETFTVTADVEDFEGTPAPQATRDFSTDFNNPTIDINPVPFGAFLNALDTESAQEIEGTSDGANDQEVTVTVTDDDGVVTELTTTTDAVTGAWSVELGTGLLQSLAEGDATISATVSSAAGNPPLAPATAGFVVDTVPPEITLNPLPFGDFLNFDDAGAPQTISGTAPGAEAGQQVTITITDSEGGVFSPLVGALVDGAGNWTLDMGLAMLAEGAVTISATVSDQAGNPAETPATLEFTKDTIAPVVTITQVTDDFVADVINADDVANGFTVTGTTDASEEGRTVTVTIDGGPGGTGVVDGDGNWTVDIPGGLALADGTTPEFIASVTDAAGNTGNSPAVNPAVNLTVPTIAFNTLAGDDILNIAESNDDELTVSGTTTGFADGDQITLSAPGIADIMVAVTGNAFTHDIPRADVFALIEAATGAAPVLDGAGDLVSAGAGTITFTASGTNNFGNESADHSTDLDLALTPPALEITDIEGAGGSDLSGVVNIQERADGLEISGTSDANGETVTVTLSDGDGFTATATGVVGAGVWTATFAAGTLNTLPDGTTEISLVADVTDANGNETATDPTSFDTDFIAPTIAIDSIESGGEAIGAFLNIEERDTGVILSGTTDAEDDQVVTVTLSAPGMPDIVRDSGPITGGEWSVSLSDLDLNALPDAKTATWTATVSDAAGNPAETPPSVTATTAFTPPEVTIDSHAVDGLMTGTVTGLEVGDTFEVTVDNNGTIGTYTATVLAGDIWEAQIDFLGGNQFDQLGNVLDPVTDAEASVVDIAGNTGTTTQQMTIYRDPGLVLELESMPVDSVTIQVFQTREAVGETFRTFFDDGQLSYTGFVGGGAPWATFLVAENDSYAPTGDGANISVTAVNFTIPPVPAALDQPVISLNFNFDSGSSDELFGFRVLPLDSEGTASGDHGGGSEIWIGSSGPDVPITVTSIASVVRGRGGDDEIDLSAGGQNTVIFEADPADNGVDTIIGFEAGADAKLPDQIGFAGLDHSDLRGNGTDVEALATGGALGANTGFVILTTALANLDAATLEAAAAGLTGEDGGDVIYLLASDGTNAALAQITFAAVDDASATIMANFTGLGDLSGITMDEILGFSAL